MPFTVALCDDDAGQLEYLHNMLAKWAEDKPFAIKVTEYSDAEQFLFDYCEHPCDILLLDIEMGKVSGMELARRLRGKGDMLPIVFITGYSEYISEGYDVEALHYLIKPVDGAKLCEVLDKYISRKNVKSDEIIIKSDDATTHISTDRIVCVEAFGRRCEITLSDGTVIPCGQSMAYFEKLQDFIHCHRSYIVNLRYVKSIGKTSVMLDTGRELPLSRRLHRDVSERFIEFYRD